MLGGPSCGVPVERVVVPHGLDPKPEVFPFYKFGGSHPEQCGAVTC